METAELLLEVRCEEIPARMLAPGIRQLGTRLFEELMALGLGPTEVETGFTPRRLMLGVQGVPVKERDRREEKLGPPVSAAWDEAGNPTRALEGFAARCGVRPEDLVEVETPKGRYLQAEVETLGRETAAILTEMIPRLLTDLNWPKPMRWGDHIGPWVRPVHGIVALFGGAVVPFELFGVQSGRTTRGHPIASPGGFQVSGVAEYRAKLGALGIEVSFEARREQLRSRLVAVAAAHGGSVVEDPWLLDKVASMCEIPGVAEGRFSEAFLELPREVLVTSLRDHQSAFTVEADGELMPRFLTVMDRADDPAGRVTAGNEWVVAARLADAKFFYQEDSRRPLAERRPDLEGIVLHVDLGTYAEKTRRVEQLAAHLCERLDLQDLRSSVLAAAALLKADLSTEMVREFTSLQGIMGGIYAREQGEPEAVWQAIYDQYLPSSVDDAIPRGAVGRITAVADRLDTLVGMFGVGLVPTGSRDPFGLRRAAQAAVRILLEGDLDLDLEEALRVAVALYDAKLERPADEVVAQLRPFVDDRVRHLLGVEGFAHDEIEAALKVRSRSLPDLRSRVQALHAARDEPGFREVVLAAKRIANILRDVPAYDLDSSRLREPAEQDLAAAAAELASTVDAAQEERSYEACLRQVATFADVLDRFFVEILVMDEDRGVRENRLALLQTIHHELARAAGLTEMVVERSESPA